MGKRKNEGDNTELPHIAYSVAEKWTGLVRNDLLLDTSDKNYFLPPGPAANAAVAGCHRNGCTAKIVKHEKDLGVDTVAAGTRDDTVLAGRTDDAIHRASRNTYVVSIQGRWSALAWLRKVVHHV